MVRVMGTIRGSIIGSIIGSFIGSFIGSIIFNLDQRRLKLFPFGLDSRRGRDRQPPCRSSGAR